MTDTVRRSLAFGSFRLEPDDRLLTLDGAPVHLAPKELALLRLLAEAGGRVVRKDEIFRRVWPGVAVSDSSVTRCIRSIRAALGERGRQGSCLETLHGRGYRFAVPVERALYVDPDEADETEDAAPANPPRLLVFPLENASGKPEDDYFCDGLSEELIDELGRRLASHIGVIARYTAMRCRGKDPSACAAELGVGFVVAGSFERREDTIRVRIELVRTSDRVQLWSARFDRPLAQAIGLGPEIARVAAEYLRSESSHVNESARPDPVLLTARLRAHNAYLQGRFLANLRAEDGIRRALERFRQAASWAPEFALAHVGIAEAHLMLAYRGFVPPLEAAPVVRAALDRAFAVEPELPAALTALGQLRLQIEWDPARAEVVLRRALEIDPGHTAACIHLGSLLNAHGRFHEAIALRRSGLERDPFAPLLRVGFAFSLLCIGRAAEALADVRELTRAEPEFVAGYAVHAYAAFRAGERAEALVVADEGLRRGTGEPLTLSGCAWVQAACGRRAAATVVAEAVAREAERRHGGAAWVAIAFAGLEDDERAMAWLERALAERSMYLGMLGADPRCARLRKLPRFREIVEAAGGRVV